MDQGQGSLLTGDLDESSPLYRKLLLDKKENTDDYHDNPLTVAPKPGFCLKTLSEKEEKIFINICTSEIVLKPKDVTEDELRKILESEDAVKFRVPMAISLPHNELDKSGKGKFG